MIYVILFWLIIQLLALLALPLAARLFHWLPDRGYSFSKALGLLAVSYMLWLGASTHVLYNNLGGILLAALLLAGISAWLLYKDRLVQQDIMELFTRQQKLLLVVEVVFTVCFILWVVLRAYAPDKIMSSGGEKFMEMAFLNGILNSQTFPPLDPWLSEFAISYYYFGYVMMAVLTRLSSAPAAIAFELYDALLFALTAQGAFGVVYNLAAATRHGIKPTEALPQVRNSHLLAGGLGALLVVGIGNLEGFMESIYTAGVLPQRFWEWLAIPDMLAKPVTGSWYPGTGGWWWWTASRVIQDLDINGQPMGISPITEFPFFSFLLGDNHPHVLALPFVLMAIGLAFNLYLRQRMKTSEPDAHPTAGWKGALTAIFLDGDWALFAGSAIILGSLGFLNTWDMPIYIGLVLLAWGMGEAARRQKLDWELLRDALLLGVSLLIAAILPYIFFYTSFSSQAGGVLPYIFPPTRLPQYLVMFGTQIFFVMIFLLTTLVHSGRQDAWRMALRMWGYVILVCLLVLVVILGTAGLVLAVQGDSTEVSSALQALGGQTVLQGLQTILLARLSNPWLFLLITVLLGLALANALLIFRLHAVPQTPAEDEQGMPDKKELAPGEASHPFVSLLIFMGLVLTFLVEFIYLRDGFGVRMNTVFKFYYQGWVMLSCAAAYGLWWLFGRDPVPGEQPALRLAADIPLRIVGVLLVAASLVYPLMGYASRVNNFNSEPNLDGTSMLARINPDDFAAIEWLQYNAAPHDGEVSTILEAPGRPYASYVYEGRISAFTGLPTLLGWPGHENQWRGEYTEPANRTPDIQTIFATHDGPEMLDLLYKWDVDYVVIGLTEQRYVAWLCEANGCEPATALRKFEFFLTPVFEDGQTRIYQVP